MPGELGGVATRKSWGLDQCKLGENPEGLFPAAGSEPWTSGAGWRRELPENPGRLGRRGCSGELPPAALEAFAVEHRAVGVTISAASIAPEAQRIEPQTRSAAGFRTARRGRGCGRGRRTSRRRFSPRCGGPWSDGGHEQSCAVDRRPGRPCWPASKPNRGPLSADRIVIAAGAGNGNACSRRRACLAGVDRPPAVAGCHQATSQAPQRPHHDAPPCSCGRRQMAGSLPLPAWTGRRFQRRWGLPRPSETGRCDERLVSSRCRGSPLDFHTVGQRPIPQDGLPIVGARRGPSKGSMSGCRTPASTLAPADRAASWPMRFLSGRRGPSPCAPMVRSGSGRGVAEIAWLGTLPEPIQPRSRWPTRNRNRSRSGAVAHKIGLPRRRFLTGAHACL